MKAFLINPEANRITEVDVDGSLVHYLELIECKELDALECKMLAPGDVIYFDKYGLLQDNPAYFSLYGTPQPLAGKAIVIGTAAGNDAPAKSTLAQVQLAATFITPKEAERALEYLARPKPKYSEAELFGYREQNQEHEYFERLSYLRRYR